MNSTTFTRAQKQVEKLENAQTFVFTHEKSFQLLLQTGKKPRRQAFKCISLGWGIFTKKVLEETFK